MNQEQMKNDLVNEVVYAMYPKLGDENADALKNCMHMFLTRYELSEKSTEVVVYKGDETQNLIRKFLIAKKIQGCTDRTLDFYRKSITNSFVKIGKMPTEVTPDDIRAYIAIRQIRDKVTSVTINNELRALSSFYGYMQKEEILMKNPTATINQIKTPKKKKKAFTELEIERMRSECRTNRERAIFEILLSTGCRVSELTQIQLTEIEGDTVMIHGKGQKDRYVYLNAKALVALEQYLAERSDDSMWLFPGCAVGINSNMQANSKDIGKLRSARQNWYKIPSLVGEKAQDKGGIEEMIRKLGKKVGVKAHPHKFRRTCATMALKNGMPILQVSKMLGHESVATTQIYLDLNEDELKAAHEKYVR